MHNPKLKFWDSFLCMIVRKRMILIFFCFHPPERNLNPKAACLKRREEEKSDGSKLPPPHLPHHSSVAPPYPNLPVSIKFEYPQRQEWPGKGWGAAKMHISHVVILKDSFEYSEKKVNVMKASGKNLEIG